MTATPDHPKFCRGARGELLLNFGSYGQEVEVAAFSGDGARVLTVQDVGVARVWDTSSGAQVAELRPTSPLEGTDAGPTTQPFCVFIEAAALDRAGARALLGLNDGTAGVWDVATGERLSTLHDPEVEPATQWRLIRAVAMSPDADVFAVGFDRRSAVVWGDDGRRQLTVLRHRERDRLRVATTGPRDTLIASLSLSSDRRFLFAGFADMTSCVWEIATGAVVFESAEHSEGIIALMAHGGRLSWATSGGSVWSCDVGVGRPDAPTRLVTSGERWLEAAFSRTGDTLISRAPDAARVQRVALVPGDARTLGRPSATGWASRAEARTVGFAGDEPAIFHPEATSTGAPTGPDAQVIVLESGGRRHVLDGGSTVTRVVVSPRGDVVATCGPSETVTLWGTTDGRSIRTLRFGDQVSASSVAFSVDGHLLAAGTLGQVTHDSLGGKRGITVYRVADGECVARLPGHDHQVHYLGFGPRSEWLASAGLDRTVRLWSLRRGLFRRAGTELARIDTAMIWNLAVLADGRIVVFHDEGIDVWRRLSTRVLRVPARVRHDTLVHVSADERSVFVAHEGQRIEQWDLRTGGLVQTVEAPIQRPEVVPTRAMAEHEPRAGAYLWRAPGGPYLHVGDGPRGWATPLSVSADGRTVLPCSAKALVVSLATPPTVVGSFPFEGRMRAACVAGGQAFAVNSDGNVFTAAV